MCMPPWMMGCSMPNISVMRVFMDVLRRLCEVLDGASDRGKPPAASAIPPPGPVDVAIAAPAPGLDLMRRRSTRRDLPASASEALPRRRRHLGGGAP